MKLLFGLICRRLVRACHCANGSRYSGNLSTLALNVKDRLVYCGQQFSIIWEALPSKFSKTGRQFTPVAHKGTANLSQRLNGFSGQRYDYLRALVARIAELANGGLSLTLQAAVD